MIEYKKGDFVVIEDAGMHNFPNGYEGESGEVIEIERGVYPYRIDFHEKEGDGLFHGDELKTRRTTCSNHKNKLIYHDTKQEWFCPWCQNISETDSEQLPDSR